MIASGESLFLRMHKWLMVGLICLVQHINAQDEVQSNANVLPMFTMGFHANPNDFYVDFGAGAEETNSRIGASVNFAFRPYYKKVQTAEATNIIRQWKEKKFFISLDTYKRILSVPLGTGEASFALGAKTGYLFGDYKGTKQRPQAGFTVNPFGGFTWFVDGVYLQLSYLHFTDRLDSVPDSRLMFSICVRIE